MYLSRDFVIGLYKAESGFPIDFDDAWKWIGYSTKGNAKRKLLQDFSEGVDYTLINIDKRVNGHRGGGTVIADKIMLTTDCFKSLAMMAGTDTGKEVRLYFLECERELKRRLEEDQQRHRHRVVRAVVDSEATPWQKRFEDEFFDQAYRITGWDRPKKGHPSCMGKFINTNVYDLFPEGVSERLKQVNPRLPSGSRARKHHQHLTTNVGQPLLDYQKGITMAVMRLSPDSNREKFKKNMQRACGESFQVELPFMDDLPA